VKIVGVSKRNINFCAKAAKMYYGTIQVLWSKAEFIKKKHRKQSMARIWCVCTPVLHAAKFESAKEKVKQSLLDVKNEMGFQFQIHNS
jgi:hypothetical protein